MYPVFYLESPNKNIKVKIFQKNKRFFKDKWFYSVNYNEQPVLLDSSLGFKLDNNMDGLHNFSIEKTEENYCNTTWTPSFGEKEIIKEEYNEIKIYLTQSIKKPMDIIIIFRAFNEGIAFQYQFPIQKQYQNIQNIHILKELTHFNLPEFCSVYEEHGTEGEYYYKKANRILPNCERPLTINYSNRYYASILEAKLNNYSRMLISPSYLLSSNLVTSISGDVNLTIPSETPWRVLIIGKNPLVLLENNHIIECLNDPNEIADTSWIKPGKVIRDVSLSTKGGIDCVDFAAAHNIQYVAYDAGWYGPERSEKSDPTTVTVDIEKLKGMNQSFDSNNILDLQKVIEYGKSKNIGIILYVNRRALEARLDDILPLYRSWGVAGLKFGFVQVGSQFWTEWLLEAVRKCAKYELMVDIHDNYRPTGYSRTYPNLLTQEGIRGNEHMPNASHNTTLPFTRFPAGAGDYTICYYDSRIKNTHAHQLAMAVIVYSPLQFVFWYDTPNEYRGEPEIEWFEEIPTTWSETRVLFGDIGKYVGIARRKNKDWFIGVITNEDAREINIKFDFLDFESKYHATIYSDDLKNQESRTKVRIEKLTIEKDMRYSLDLAPSGGSAIMLKKG